MIYLKTYFQDEYSFFWNNFGYFYDFKLILYRENLISIEQIIQSVKKENSPLTVEYFLPEVIESAPEIFEKELKSMITVPYSRESIEKFKEIREKHFKWLHDFRGDFKSPIYKEIKKDKLRLSLKTDDIETFFLEHHL